MAPSYDLSAIKAALTAQSKGSGGGTQGTKNTYWSLKMGEHEIRFLPLKTPTGEPFLTIGFYGEPLVEKRIVAPKTFGLPDFIYDQYEELRNSKKHPDGWAVAKHLRAKDRYFAAIIVRGEEDKGPQVWEFSKEVRDQIYGILTHKDNVDEDMLSPKVGYDFTVTVAPVIEGNKPRMFKGSPVKGVTLQPRKKPSPLSKDEALANKWLTSVPDLAAFYQKMCKTPDEMAEILENFAASLTGAAPKPEGTDYNAGKTATEAPATKAEENLNAAFDGLLDPA